MKTKRSTPETIFGVAIQKGSQDQKSNRVINCPTCGSPSPGAKYRYGEEWCKDLFHDRLPKLKQLTQMEKLQKFLSVFPPYAAIEMIKAVVERPKQYGNNERCKQEPEDEK